MNYSERLPRIHPGPRQRIVKRKGGSDNFFRRRDISISDIMIAEISSCFAQIVFYDIHIHKPIAVERDSFRPLVCLDGG